ncbi:MAG TPA: S8 family serine peptidase, partial [Pyrinomonadaceae bacterium]|nr:S8 family serine peptidase [Pyrinomonadaceae bacterium]
MLPGNIAQAQLLNTVTSLLKLSPDLLEQVTHATLGEKVNVIVQSEGRWGLSLDLLLLALGGKVTGTYQNLDVRAVEMPASNILALASDLKITFISPDRATLASGHVSLTTGADAARDGSGGTASGLDGTGVGIAVLDSGIDVGHKSFLGKNNNQRVVVSRDFTGEGRTDDPFGHGTHVASIAAGNGHVSNSAYLGVAPNANIVNLRVLGSRGTGSSSKLLAALDWLLTNQKTYNVRVVNMSLGARAVDSYRNDPVCKAVRKLVDAGLVVTAAAGNDGKDSAGQKLYGHIHSPGDEPSAITVGAANTFGTDARSDDAVASYSSRGPTRGVWKDASGVRHYDNLIKPDIIAPGNKLVAAESAGNLLVTQHPELDAGVSGTDSRKMMYLSGTSMAT